MQICLIWTNSPDLNMTPLAAFFRFLPSAPRCARQKNAKKQQEVSDLNWDQWTKWKLLKSRVNIRLLFFFSIRMTSHDTWVTIYKCILSFWQHVVVRHFVWSRTDSPQHRPHSGPVLTHRCWCYFYFHILTLCDFGVRLFHGPLAHTQWQEIYCDCAAVYVGV